MRTQIIKKREEESEHEQRNLGEDIPETNIDFSGRRCKKDQNTGDQGKSQKSTYKTISLSHFIKVI